MSSTNNAPALNTNLPTNSQVSQGSSSSSGHASGHNNNNTMSTTGHGSSQGGVPALDIHALAAALQQAQKTLASNASGASGNKITDTPHDTTNSHTTAGSFQQQQPNQQQQQQPDVQAILMEMQRLKNERDTFLKDLEEEKQKSKILVEDKKKEMEGFLGGTDCNPPRN